MSCNAHLAQTAAKRNACFWISGELIYNVHTIFI
jgi:hypothetical protein